MYLNYAFCITAKVKITEYKVWYHSIGNISVKSINWIKKNAFFISFSHKLIDFELKKWNFVFGILTAPGYRPKLDACFCNRMMVTLRLRLNWMHHEINVYLSYRIQCHWFPNVFAEIPCVTIYILEKSVAEIWPFLWLRQPQCCPYARFSPQRLPIRASKNSIF